MTTIFLDFDGVLHPAECHLDNAGKPYLKTAALPVKYENMQLFEYAHLLDEVLRKHQDVQIVLTTSWVEVFGFDYSKSSLPASLQEKVVGSIYTPESPGATRPQRILAYAERHGLHRWFAVDDDPYGWGDGSNLLLCGPFSGISDTRILDFLAGHLKTRWRTAAALACAGEIRYRLSCVRSPLRTCARDFSWRSRLAASKVTSRRAV